VIVPITGQLTGACTLSNWMLDRLKARPQETRGRHPSWPHGSGGDRGWASMASGTDWRELGDLAFGP